MWINRSLDELCDKEQLLIAVCRPQVLIDWINDVLVGERIIVKDLAEDLYDGQVLQKLFGEALAELSGCQWDFGYLVCWCWSEAAPVREAAITAVIPAVTHCGVNLNELRFYFE